MAEVIVANVLRGYATGILAHLDRIIPLDLASAGVTEEERAAIATVHRVFTRYLPEPVPAPPSVGGDFRVYRMVPDRRYFSTCRDFDGARSAGLTLINKGGEMSVEVWHENMPVWAGWKDGLSGRLEEAFMPGYRPEDVRP